jgi:hypothetical protein
MTYLVDRYVAAESAINASESNAGFTGTLTSYGMPVAGAKVSVYAVDDGTLNITARASLKQYGYVAILFLDGAEIERLGLPFLPGQRFIGADTRNSMGQFKITTSPPTIVMFNFSGNPKLRLSSALWRYDRPSGSAIHPRDR